MVDQVCIAAATGPGDLGASAMHFFLIIDVQFKLLRGMGAGDGELLLLLGVVVTAAAAPPVHEGAPQAGDLWTAGGRVEMWVGWNLMQYDLFYFLYSFHDLSRSGQH